MFSVLIMALWKNRTEVGSVAKWLSFFSSKPKMVVNIYIIIIVQHFHSALLLSCSQLDLLMKKLVGTLTIYRSNST